MATYGGVTFYVLAQPQDNTISRPLLLPEDFGVVRTKLPYVDKEQIQFTGRGNARFTLKCEIYSDTDFATLFALAGFPVGRTLGDPFGVSVDYENMVLTEIKSVWRVTFDEEIHFDAVFEQVLGV